MRQFYGIRHGIPLKRRPSPSDFIRFLAKVTVDKKTGCWNWTAHKNKKGYGQFWWDGKMHWAHRWSRQAWRGQFKSDIQGNHKCLNPSCVNPDHISGLTCSRNTALGNKTRKRKIDNDIPF